jgi:hypothetical protein
MACAVGMNVLPDGRSFALPAKTISSTADRLRCRHERFADRKSLWLPV